MDYSPYDISFTAEGRRRVHAFSYILAYSRRQYVRFVETQDFGKRLVNRPFAGACWSGIFEGCRKPNRSIGAD